MAEYWAPTQTPHCFILKLTLDKGNGTVREKDSTKHISYLIGQLIICHGDMGTDRIHSPPSVLCLLLSVRHPLFFSVSFHSKSDCPLLTHINLENLTKSFNYFYCLSANLGLCFISPSFVHSLFPLPLTFTSIIHPFSTTASLHVSSHQEEQSSASIIQHTNRLHIIDSQSFSPR